MCARPGCPSPFKNPLSDKSECISVPRARLEQWDRWLEERGRSVVQPPLLTDQVRNEIGALLQASVLRTGDSDGTSTPRTDSQDEGGFVTAKFARQLEREVVDLSMRVMRKAEHAADWQSRAEIAERTLSARAEPVAWRWHWKGGDESDVWAYTEHEPQGTRIVKEPLFADRMPPEEKRKLRVEDPAAVRVMKVRNEPTFTSPSLIIAEDEKDTLLDYFEDWTGKLYIEFATMTRAEIDALPEFDGF